jgi:hypothetical protein
MNESKAIKALAIIFFVGGIWDTFGGVVYSFMVGAGGDLDNPPVHRFYALFIASFLFCFAYLQFLSAFNIRRYLLNVGCVTIGRVLYVILLYGYIFGAAGFPKTFWWTGIGDSLLSICNIALALASNEVRLRDLFLPCRETA